jgi:hypothetical protein
MFKPWIYLDFRIDYICLFHMNPLAQIKLDSTRDFFQKSDLFINKQMAENPPGYGKR